MKKIVMTKYGFIRNEREDFSDDGSRFQGWATSPVSRLRITKHVSDGQVYLSCDMNGCKLDYTEYSKLPHYQKSGWDYNGVSVESLTDQDMVDFYNACVAYETEYLEAETKVVFPTIAELRNQCIILNKIRQAEVDHIESLLKEVSLKLFLVGTSDYELRTIRDYYKKLKKEFFDISTYPQSIQYSNYGRNFVKETNPHLKENWYYTQLKEFLEKYQ